MVIPILGKEQLQLQSKFKASLGLFRRKKIKEGRERKKEKGTKRNIKMELKLNGKIKKKNTCTRYCFRVQEDKL